MSGNALRGQRPTEWPREVAIPPARAIPAPWLNKARLIRVLIPGHPWIEGSSRAGVTQPSMVYVPRNWIMVRKPRLSIAGLMGVVLVASLGLTALRSGSEEWSGAT